jgi:hypothetical protein
MRSILVLKFPSSVAIANLSPPSIHIEMSISLPQKHMKSLKELFPTSRQLYFCMVHFSLTLVQVSAATLNKDSCET